MSTTTATTPTLKVTKGEDGRWLVTDGDGFVHSEHDTRTAARAAKAAGPAAPTEDLSDMDRGDLYKRAQADHEAARVAKANGDPIPATPYLDELNRRHAAGEKGPRKSKATTTPRVTDPRYAEADQAKEKGGRGDTRKLTPDELDAYVAKVRKAHPDGTCAGELKVARHLDGVSVSLARWNDAWKRHG